MVDLINILCLAALNELRDTKFSHRNRMDSIKIIIFSMASLFISRAENINNNLKMLKLKILKITKCLRVMRNPKHRSEYYGQTSILQAKIFSVFLKNICYCLRRWQ